jgi:hypothetical protein
VGWGSRARCRELDLTEVIKKPVDEGGWSYSGAARST